MVLVIGSERPLV